MSHDLYAVNLWLKPVDHVAHAVCAQRILMTNLLYVVKSLYECPGEDEPPYTRPPALTTNIFTELANTVKYGEGFYITFFHEWPFKRISGDITAFHRISEQHYNIRYIYLIIPVNVYQCQVLGGMSCQ